MVLQQPLLWIILDNKRDPYNEDSGARLKPDSATVETSGSSYAVDFLANGFKLRSSYNTVNKQGDNFIYLAFAETPFKYANAR